MLRIYNTLGRKLETFESIKGKSIGLYTCGPTVYDYAHIGNLRTYIFEDILERVLKANGYKVKRVMNITDVGHLTGEATDEGEDKLEKGAEREHKTVLEVAQFYTDAFLSDIRELNIEVPETLAPATHFIKEQIELVEQLVEKGFAYDTPSAVYFDVAKLEDYGKLSGQSLKEKITAARKEVVTDPEKRNVADFALWFKRVGKFTNHSLHWPSPWGDGFPGWHIECSAISRHFLGQPFDIHTGGVDHIGTHHTNEIAQSEAAYGKPLANIWMHAEFLLIDAARMGKSQGNFFTLKDIKDHGVDPIAYRYLTLGAHYRSQLNFAWESLEAAANSLRKLSERYHELLLETSNDAISSSQDYEADFMNAFNDDLNAPKALAVLHTMLKDIGLSAKKKVELMNSFDRILGLGFATTAQKSAEIPPEVLELARKREECRANKQFTQSDLLRSEIEALGYEVEDTPTGPLLRPK